MRIMNGNKIQFGVKLRDFRHFSQLKTRGFIDKVRHYSQVSETQYSDVVHRFPDAF